MAPRSPQRRCTGCGRIAAKTQLVRLALVGDDPRSQKVVIDGCGRLPGRGAYLCAIASERPSPDCLERAVRRGGIVRTLRCNAKIDSSELLAPLAAADGRAQRDRSLESVGR